MSLRRHLLGTTSPVPFLAARSSRVVGLMIAGQRHMMEVGYLPEQIASRDPWELAGIGAKAEADKLVKSGAAKAMLAGAGVTAVPRPANDDGLLPGEACDHG